MNCTKLLLIIACALLALTGCSTLQSMSASSAKPPTAASAPPAQSSAPSESAASTAPAGTVSVDDAKTLLDKLVNVDAPAAIARAQAVAADPKSAPEEVTYANARIVCYQTIVAIAPDFNVLHLAPAGQPAGVLDAFEVVAEAAEGVNAVASVGLPKQDLARFNVACGWIGQRTLAIAGNLGLRVANVGAGAAMLLPK